LGDHFSGHARTFILPQFALFWSVLLMSESSSHSYYDWQISTLMLAYDVVDPLPRDAVERMEERESRVRVELRDLVMATLPEEYLKNPELDYPPQVMAMLTRATLKRARQITG